MSGWDTAQKYKFDDYIFDQRMRVSILKTDPTSNGATTIEVHLGFKSKDKNAVMASYEKARQMFFKTGLKSGKFYYKSDTEYINVNIIEKEEILHPKGKSYYVRLKMATEDDQNIKEIEHKEEIITITSSNNTHIFKTVSDITNWLPFKMELDIQNNMSYIEIYLNGKGLGFEYSLLAGDIVKIDTSIGEYSVYRGGSLIAKRRYDGDNLMIVQNTNEFSFGSSITDADTDLFNLKIDVEEKI